MNRRLVETVAPLSMLAAPFGAAANEVPAAPADAAAETAAPTDGEIVVTARRREENLQDVPIAVTAFSGEQLEHKQITQAADLVQSTPSLQVQPATSQRQSGSVTIRGQGQAYTGVLPSVITYLADVPLDPNGGAAFSTLDLQSAQVLRGPQGTLFGRNTTGGAVLFVPKAPTDEFGGNVSASVGNYGLFDIRGALNIPVTDTLAVRVAGQSVKRSGFTDNIFNGKALDDQDFYALRAFIRWEPVDGFKNDLIVSTLRADENGTAFILHDIVNNGRSGYTYQGGALRTQLALQQARGPRVVNSNEDLGAKRRMFFLANTTSYEITPDVTVRNIFGYQRIKACYGSDLDGSPVPFNISTCFPNRFQQAFGRPIENETDLRQFTNEFQLVGNAFDNRLDWIVGGFFLSSKTPGSLDRFRFHRIGKSAGTVSFASTIVDDQSKALFAQGTFQILDNLKATAGFRYTWDKRALSTGTYRSTNEGATYTCAAPSIPGQTHAASDPIDRCFTVFHGKFSDYGYTFSLDWQANRDLLLYATTRRGYKSGGFNTISASDPSLTSFDPEVFTDYELGVKKDFRGGPVTGRFNASIFYGDYTNIQRSYNALINGAVTPIIRSAAAANMWGAELEAQVNFGDHFELSGFYSHLDYSYKKGTYTQPLTGQDISSSLFQAVADNSGSATVRAYGDLADGSELSASLTLYATSAIAFTSDTVNNPHAIAPGYTTWSANLSLREAFGQPMDISLWARNLTDKNYVVGGLGLESVLGVTSRIYGEPRTFGATVSYRF